MTHWPHWVRMWLKLPDPSSAQLPPAVSHQIISHNPATGEAHLQTFGAGHIVAGSSHVFTVPEGAEVTIRRIAAS